MAGTSLVAGRTGFELMGFELKVLALTVAHFHFAGFAAALVAGLVCHATGSRLAEAAAVTVPLGTGLVFAGYFPSDEVELGGAVVLTLGMWAVAWVMWRDVRSRSNDPVTRLLFAGSSVVLVATMLLALSWAAGHVGSAVPFLPLDVMAATHGVANALGFAVCGLLAWGRLRKERGQAADDGFETQTSGCMVDPATIRSLPGSALGRAQPVPGSTIPPVLRPGRRSAPLRDGCHSPVME